ncbi:hypothetical protein B0H19DRAFT_1212976 [Mycena capillaripes]|nr:hypothetical protein B0H19DRAFT_1212976 [Mycena capillaripes]
MTQSISYKGIKELNDPVSRKATEENVKKIQEALKENFGNSPKPSAIWASIRQKDISRNVRNFLWKSMHSAHRLGKYWTHIPECEERANCAHCGELESLEHILFECQSPGQSQIWALAEELWRKKHTEWPTLSMGAALGCGMAIFKDDNGKPQPGLTRLYKILITESMFAIWKARCDSVIKKGGVAPNVNEVHNRWVSVLNERLNIDVNQANKLKFGRHSVDPALVRDT